MISTDRLDGKLEPEAQPAASMSDAALISIAVSLKRIADAVSGPDKPDIVWLAELAGQAFSVGMRGR